MKIARSPPTQRPRTLFLGWWKTLPMLNTKNQVRGLCVGADILILIFGSFQNHWFVPKSLVRSKNFWFVPNFQKGGMSLCPFVINIRFFWCRFSIFVIAACGYFLSMTSGIIVSSKTPSSNMTGWGSSNVDWASNQEFVRTNTVLDGIQGVTRDYTFSIFVSFFYFCLSF